MYRAYLLGWVDTNEQISCFGAKKETGNTPFLFCVFLFAPPRVESDELMGVSFCAAAALPQLSAAVAFSSGSGSLLLTHPSILYCL